MKHIRILTNLALGLILLNPGILQARFQAGGLHFMRSPDLIIDRQDIIINPERISVNYRFSNTSSLDITETLVFTLPPQSQFAVTVDNQAVTYNIVQRAISNSGMDISNYLKNLGLSLDPISAIQSIDASPNRESIRTQLIAMDLIDPTDETPKWLVKVFYYWQQKFPAHTAVDIHQTYKPAVVNNNIKLKTPIEILNFPIKLVKKLFSVAVNWSLQGNPEDKAAAKELQAQLEKSNPQIRDFCPSLKDYLVLSSPAAKFDPNTKTMASKELNYDYYSDDTWVTPINHFSLAIETPKNMHPLLCWNGEFKAQGDKLLFAADNYVPLQRVSILYVEK